MKPIKTKLVHICRCFWRRALWWSCPGKSCSHGCSFWWARSWKLSISKSSSCYDFYISPFLPSFLSKWSSYNLQKQLYVYIFSCLRQTFCLSFFSVFLQFNDALMYTTPVQSAQYKLNSVLSLAGMKVRDTLQTQLLLFLIPSLSHLLVFLYTEILAIVNYWCNVCSNHLNITHTFLSVIYGFLLFFPGE